MAHHRKKIDKAVRRRRFVDIRREKLDSPEEYYSGYLLWVSDTLWALHGVVDYRSEGYSFFQNKDVSRWRVEKNKAAERLRTFLLQQDYPNGIPHDLPSALTDCNDWSFLKDAHLVAPLVWIEMEKKRKGAGWLGRVVHVGRKSVTLRLVSPTGEWESVEETRTFDFRNITYVRLGGYYDNALWRYLNRNGDALESAGGYF